MNSKPVTVFKCEQCGAHYVYHSAAENCCTQKPPRLCADCGQPMPDNSTYFTACTACRIKRRVNGAQKLTLDEYLRAESTPWFYDEKHSEFAEDIETILEWYADDQEPLPDHVWGCKINYFRVDVDSALESASQEMDDEFSYDRLHDLDALYKFVAEWNEKQTTYAITVDYQQLVLIPESLKLPRRGDDATRT